MADFLSESQKEEVREMFDSYCKKILKHAAMDYDKKAKRITKHEISISALPPNIDALISIDKYFSQNHFFEVSGVSIVVKGAAVAEIIACLPLVQREIILLSYFTDISDGEIGVKLDMSRRMVKYYRDKAIIKLRNIYKENI
jgi:DNA-directed RNA polymerase specialized sigma24 family protein